MAQVRRVAHQRQDRLAVAQESCCLGGAAVPSSGAVPRQAIQPVQRRRGSRWSGSERRAHPRIVWMQLAHQRALWPGLATLDDAPQLREVLLDIGLGRFEQGFKPQATIGSKPRCA